MMPVIRLNDGTFTDLKTISTWLGTDTPSRTVDEIVRRTMDQLDLERDVEIEASSIETTEESILKFEKAPGLSFTKPIFASVNDHEVENPKWAKVLCTIIREIKAKGIHGEQLVNVLQIPAKHGEYSEEGFKYHSGLGISVQGQSASEAWREVERLSRKWGIPVIVKFRWRDTQKAQHPGRMGMLHSGKN